jgi:hypothetical protein
VDRRAAVPHLVDDQDPLAAEQGIGRELEEGRVRARLAVVVVVLDRRDEDVPDPEPVGQHARGHEAAAIGVPHAVKGETIVVVCTLRRGETDDADLRAAIARRVVEDLGKTLKPEAVAVVPALPKTRSGKIMRRVVRAAWLGLDPGDLSALDDPATIEAIRRAGPAGVAGGSD